ncbi:hypothetical protein DY245_16305 [Streptomyces inhibens]|uniref:Uncharacterized protein n=1 Tax=Streptomyces inhibens TaxID=2293571 RepID=A0A371Q3U0_STRIH|nr:hypothetical protein [Streptomyces inhibens]REK89329.1 hypothetical protein DY245_16305 [Streptomyces inhibens]
MKYVDLDAQVGGLTGVIDPTRYLGRLPELSGSLPPGALAFATDPQHYSFSGKRCVKDLTLQQVSFLGNDGQDIEACFRHNCWKHDEDLVIRWTGVVHVRIETPDGTSWSDLETVILDEILPHDHGCSHEMAFRPGTLMITCRDITATWAETDCPDARQGQGTS